MYGGRRKIVFDDQEIIDLIKRLKFKKYPILIGGKAMEYYNLRTTCHDIDFIVSKKDFTNLKKIYGINNDFPKHTPGVTDHDNNMDFFLNINGYDYDYFNVRAITDKYLKIKIINKTDLILLKAITGYDEIHKPPPPPEVRKKSFKDLQLLVDSISRDHIKSIT